MRNLIVCSLLTAAAVVASMSPADVDVHTPQDAERQPESNEAQSIPAVTLEPVVETPASPAMPQLIAVRARGWDVTRRAIYANATGFVLGTNKIVTVGHLIDGMTGTPIVEVQLPDWRRVAWQRGTTDIMLLTVPDLSADERVTRAATYGERVTITGLVSGMAQSGTVSNVEPLRVALELAATGVQVGDSGGPVMGEDGSIVGVVHGRDPREHRVCYFTSILDLPTLATPSPVASDQPDAVTPVAAPAANNCPGGVCPAPQRYYARPVGPLRRLFR